LRKVPRGRRRARAAGLALVLVGAFAFAVPAAADPPVVNDDSATTPQDTAVVIDVVLNDTDPESNPLTISAPPGDPPHGTTAVTGDNKIQYTPDAAFLGSDSFTYEACDNEPSPLCDSATVTVQVGPQINVGDVTVAEGNGGTVNATFAVTLSFPDTTAPVTVNYATSNGSALAASDYTAVTGTLTFPTGTTTPSAPLEVQVAGDTVDEPDEGFAVNLSMAARALIQDGQGAGTITDEDPQTTVSVSDVSVTEGNAGTTPATFNVSLGVASGKQVTVNYSTGNGSATAPGDFQTASGQVTFAPGETQKTVAVNVIGDTTFEENETFNLSLSNPVNAEIVDGQGVGTIQNNDASPSGCDITGTAGADNLTGTNASERICGLGGDDTISGGGGDDEILGAEGNDRISGGDGADAIEGGRGDDRLSGGAGGDSLEGGAGSDVLNGDGGDDTMNGEGGRDVARGGAGSDVMDAGAGNDNFAGGGGSDRIDGGAGNDRVVGEDGNDFVDGSTGNDRVDGGPGNDRVRGQAGVDLVTGGSGNDNISGGGGADHVVFRSRVTVDLSKARASGEGRDRVFTVEAVTGSGAGDTLIGNSAPNTLNGGGGNDRLFGRGGGDRLNGGAGNDILHGEAGRDLLVGASGNDTCNVGPGGGVTRSC
jgi:Ca2+-binding RTX toxin-like protein